MNNLQKIENRDKWQELLNRALFKTFFHTLEWESFLEQEYDWLKFERYVYKDEVLLSLARYKQGSKEYLVSHPFCEYGGPLPLVKGMNINEFKKELLDNFRMPLKVSLHPFLFGRQNSYFDSQMGAGFPPVGVAAEASRETFFIDRINELGIDYFWHDCLDRNRRRSIKKAKEADVKVVEYQTEKELRELYHFYVQNLKGHRTVVYPFSFFEFFSQSPKAKILLAKKGKKNLGGNIFLLYEGIVHSFLCGFDKRYKDLGIHSLVLWSMIEKTKEMGFSTFDLGATKKDSPLRSFKQRWSKCSVVPNIIFEIRQDYPDSSTEEKMFLRKVWGCLPAGLIKLLSPYFIKHKL